MVGVIQLSFSLEHVLSFVQNDNPDPLSAGFKMMSVFVLSERIALFCVGDKLSDVLKDLFEPIAMWLCLISRLMCALHAAIGGSHLDVSMNGVVLVCVWKSK